MRTDILQIDKDYALQKMRSKTDDYYCHNKSYNEKRNHEDSMYCLVSRINSHNATRIKNTMLVSSALYKSIVNNHRAMLLQANFLYEFAYLNQERYIDLHHDLEEWVLNEKACFHIPTDLNDDDGVYTIVGHLDVDSEMEDDSIIITTIYNYNLANAIHIFLNWYNSEIHYHEKQRNIR